MTPSDIYTVLIAMIVILVLVNAWTFDRINELKQKIKDNDHEIARLKRGQPVKQYHWPTDVR